LLHFFVKLPRKSVHRNRLVCLAQSDVTGTRVNYAQKYELQSP